MNTGKFILLAVLAVASIQTLIGSLVYMSFGNWSERGQFGDMFGLSNSTFSGLALAAIAYTIYLQREELRLQREELKSTREELARTADAQQRSEKALAEQAAITNMDAKLNGTLAMLHHLRNERELLGSVTGVGQNEEKRIQIKDLDTKILDMKKTLDVLYAKVMRYGDGA